VAYMLELSCAHMLCKGKVPLCSAGLWTRVYSPGGVSSTPPFTP
jgi:hypothetical protein